MKKTTMIFTQEYNLSEFRETGNLGIKTLWAKIPGASRIVSTAMTPKSMFITFEITRDFEQPVADIETDIIQVSDLTRFSLTPEYDAWISKKIESLPHDEMNALLKVQPLKNEYEFLHHDFVYQTSFYIHSYKFSPFDVQTI